MLNVCILIGCTISPQMVKPFLADGIDVTTTKDSILGNKSVVVNTDNSTLISENNTEIFKGVTDFETQISYGFLIIGLFILFGAVLHFCHLCLCGCNRKHIHLLKKTSRKLEHVDVKQLHFNGGSRIFQLFAICLIGIASFVHGAHEDMFGSFLVDYSVKGLNWNIKYRTDVTSIFWASIGISMFMGSLLIRRISVSPLMVCSIVLILITNVIWYMCRMLTTICIPRT